MLPRGLRRKTIVVGMATALLAVLLSPLLLIALSGTTRGGLG